MANHKLPLHDSNGKPTGEKIPMKESIAMHLQRRAQEVLRENRGMVLRFQSENQLLDFLAGGGAPLFPQSARA